jgi:hypothetical protein
LLVAVSASRKKAFANKKPPGGKEGKAQGLYEVVKAGF